jgi:hypothetical protein
MTMRSTPVGLGLLGLLAVLTSCTSETTPIVYIGMTYQVRCLDCQPRDTDPNPRDVRAVDGEAGYNLQCDVNKSGGTQRVTFSAEHQSSDSAKKYLLTVKGARIGGDESDGPCEVRIVEGDTTYTGACSTDEPSDDHPCQISVKEKNGVIKGSLYCDRIPTMGSLSQIRYLVAPYSNEDPAKFELYGCSGL